MQKSEGRKKNQLLRFNNGVERSKDWLTLPPYGGKKGYLWFKGEKLDGFFI
jgi:hypothetical protein